MTQTTTDQVDVAGRNSVELQGRVSGVPQERVLPSGDSVWVFRVVVPREPARGRASVDTIDCAVWVGRARRTVAALAGGEQVAVTGALRRHFFKAGAATASRVEVEVTSVRVLRKVTPRGTRRATSA